MNLLFSTSLYVGPEKAKLRRVRPKDLIMPFLSLIAAYALLGMLTDIDFALVWAVVQDASWILIIIGFLTGQTSFLSEATGMLFATGYDLPLRPLTILQVSVKWIGLAVPSAAGRVTMNTVFLRKHGMTPSIALTQGVLDGIAGFVVEAGILLVAFLAADIPLGIETGVVRLEKVRSAVLPALKDAWGLSWSLLRDPKRTLGLLGSNLASRMILAITMWFILQVGSVLLRPCSHRCWSLRVWARTKRSPPPWSSVSQRSTSLRRRGRDSNPRR